MHGFRIKGQRRPLSPRQDIQAISIDPGRLLRIIDRVGIAHIVLQYAAAIANGYKWTQINARRHPLWPVIPIIGNPVNRFCFQCCLELINTFFPLLRLCFLGCSRFSGGLFFS